LTSVQRERHRAKAMFRKFVAAGVKVVDELVAERRDEARREDQEAITTGDRAVRGRKS
jgi:hypothetical protein